jgi:DNA-binding response OmpR family regulator
MVFMQPTIPALQVELSKAHKHILELEKRLGETPEVLSQLCFGFSRNESKILNLLMTSKAASKERIMDVLYETEADCPGDHITVVYISKIRKKLKQHGIRILTHYGLGWSLKDQDKTFLRELLAKPKTGTR